MIVANTAGVFTSIVDKSQIPETTGVSTTAAQAFISPYGEDNTWIWVSGVKDLVEKFGTPSKRYGQAFLNAYRFSMASNSLYVMRVLPNADDTVDKQQIDPATFSHVILCLAQDANNPSIKTIIPIYFNKTSDASNVIQDSERTDAPTRFTNKKFTLPDGTSTNTNIHSYLQNIVLTDEQKDALSSDTTIKSTFLDPKNVTELDNTLIPIAVIYAIGRGSYYNQIRFKITSVPDQPEVFAFEVYMVTDNGTINLETFYVTFNPNIRDGSNESMFIDHVINTYSKYLRCLTNENVLPQINSKVGDKTLIEDVLTNTAYSIDSYNTSYPLYSFSLKCGRDGDIFKDGLLNTAVYTQCLLKAYQGLYDPAILNKEEIVIDLLFDANFDMSVKQALVDLAKKRADCFVLLDLKPAGDLNGILDNMKNVFSWLDAWQAAVYAPFTVIRNPVDGTLEKVSPSYHACYIYPNNDKQGVWKVPAGTTRGVLTDIEYPIVAIDALPETLSKLYANNINPIVKKNGVYCFYGNRTAQRTSSALSDINVVRTLLKIDRDLSRFCENFIWENNTPDTWLKIEEGIKGILSTYQKEGALYEYSVEVGATDYEIKHHIIHVNVYLYIVRAVKVIPLQFTIK